MNSLWDGNGGFSFRPLFFEVRVGSLDMIYRKEWSASLDICSTAVAVMVAGGAVRLPS